MPVMEPHLLLKARRALGLSQGNLGRRLGASERTGQRWGVGGAFPSEQQVQQLAVQVHPLDPGLAGELARAAGTTLLALGLGPPPPPPPPPPFLPPPDRIVDSVVCAAAAAMDVMPRAIRPALLAAMTRAREIGLGVVDLERALRGQPESASTSAAARKSDAKKPGKGPPVAR
jgi:hypothetical protein